jgi:hypothetical protein
MPLVPACGLAIFHICTCDDVTLVNEKSIVSWNYMYMKSNKKCVFNVPTPFMEILPNITSQDILLFQIFDSWEGFIY